MTASTAVHERSERLDDWAVVEAVAQRNLPSLVRLLYTADEVEDLRVKCRTPAGRVSASGMWETAIGAVRAAAPNVLTLALALQHHEGALRASLRAIYQMRLDDLRDLPAREAADLVAWLPAGCALWKAVGGPAALSDEVRALRDVEFRLRVLDWRMRQSKGTQPKPTPDPPYAHEKRVAEAKQSRKAERFIKRHSRG